MNTRKIMRSLKISVGVLAVLAAATPVFVRCGWGDSKKAVKSTAANKQTAANVLPSASHSQPAGAISANPVNPQEQGEQYAAFDRAYKQARALYQSGDLAGAEAACFNAINAVPVIQGKRGHVPFVPYLLGQIYLDGGQYQKAIYWLQGAHRTTMASGLNLDLALAYLRLGDDQDARRFYSDRAITQYGPYLPQDLPGTGTPQALEASILLARGLDASLEGRDDDAFPDFQRANQLAPENTVIAYHYATLLTGRGRSAEAIPLFRLVARRGHGAIAEEANRRQGPH